jgi:tRNA(Ile)-lysidine synthase
VGHAVAALVPPRGRVCAGFSGGLDSTVLLDLLVPLARRGAIELTALHVHHGLSPNADAWAEACARFCAERGVPLAIERVAVLPSGEGLEAAARAARYAAFAARDADCIARPQRNVAARAARSFAKSSPAWCEERVNGLAETIRNPLV